MAIIELEPLNAINVSRGARPGQKYSFIATSGVDPVNDTIKLKNSSGYSLKAPDGSSLPFSIPSNTLIEVRFFDDGVSEFWALMSSLPSNAGTIQRTNSEAFTIAVGRPVKLNGSTGVLLAQANSLSNVAFGLAASTALSGATLTLVYNGILRLEDWTDSLGSPSLTPGQKYYLKTDSLGMIRSGPPSASGDVVFFIGDAISDKELVVSTDLMGVI